MTPPRRPSRKRPTRSSPREEVAGTGVVLEQMHAQFKVVIEMLQEHPTRREVVEILQEFPTRREMNERFDHVEAEIRLLRDHIALKADAALLVALDQRVTALERRAG
jgi:hypothetical protein